MKEPNKQVEDWRVGRIISLYGQQVKVLRRCPAIKRCYLTQIVGGSMDGGHRYSDATWVTRMCNKQRK